MHLGHVPGRRASSPVPVCDKFDERMRRICKNEILIRHEGLERGYSTGLLCSRIRLTKGGGLLLLLPPLRFCKLALASKREKAFKRRVGGTLERC